MTADERRPPAAVVPEERRRRPYYRPSKLSEADLLAGYAVRLEMLRDLGDAPCCAVRAAKGSCPCRGHGAA